MTTYFESLYKIETNQERYIEKHFDLCQLHQFIIPLSQFYKRFVFMTEVYNFEIHQNQYDSTKDNFQEINNFDQLLQYHKEYITGLNNNGIRTNEGPLSYETNFIKKDLIKFYDKEIITTDSEPGLVSFFSDGNYSIQKPYLFLICKTDTEVLGNLYDRVVLNDMLSLIDYNPSEHSEMYKNLYPNLTDIETYEFLFFGMRNPTEEEMTNPELMEKYFDYVFTNKFFTEILEMF